MLLAVVNQKMPVLIAGDPPNTDPSCGPGQTLVNGGSRSARCESVQLSAAPKSNGLPSTDNRRDQSNVGIANNPNIRNFLPLIFGAVVLYALWKE